MTRRDTTAFGRRLTTLTITVGLDLGVTACSDGGRDHQRRLRYPQFRGATSNRVQRPKGQQPQETTSRDLILANQKPNRPVTGRPRPNRVRSKSAKKPNDTALSGSQSDPRHLELFQSTPQAFWEVAQYMRSVTTTHTHHRSPARPQAWAAVRQRLGTAVISHHAAWEDNMTRAPRHRTRLSTVHIRRHATVLLLAGSLTALAGCSGSSPKSNAAEKQSPTSAEPSKAPAASGDPQSEAKQDVLKAYNAFWSEQVKAYAKANIKGTDLKKYATKDALGQAMGDVLVMQKAGTATEGAPTHDAKVTSLTAAGSPPKASLQDCLDISHWKTIKKKTGKVQPFPSAQPLRYVTTAKAEKWGKQWMITELTPDGKHTC